MRLYSILANTRLYDLSSHRIIARSEGASKIDGRDVSVVDFGMNAQDAVDAPRIHHQWQPDKLYLEPGISPDTVAILKSRGYDVDHSPGTVLARVEAIVNRGGWLQGGSDGRASGKAAGY